MTLQWSDEAVRERMELGWSGGLPEGTACGNGSRLEHTAAIRERLPRLASDYGINSVCDAGAGDLHWMKHVEWDVTYSAFDLVPRDPFVAELDITREALPACDLILCRLVLNHLDPERVQRALRLFRQSGKYLLATQHPGTKQAKSVNVYNEWNLSIAPFELGEPLECVPDARGSLSLWSLS